MLSSDMVKSIAATGVLVICCLGAPAAAQAQAAPVVHGEPATRPSVTPGRGVPNWLGGEEEAAKPQAGGASAEIPAPASAVTVDSAASTQPFATPAPDASRAQTGEDARERPRVETGMLEYLAVRFAPHEPMYFVAGFAEPTSKFQFSLKYQVIGDEGSLARAAPWVTGFHLAYSQTSFWDLAGGESNPFFDSSYRPEVLYLYEQPDAKWLPGLARFDVQTGLRHESNGQEGPDSRSLNIVYVQPVFTFGDPGTGAARGGFFVAVAPRVWGYVFNLDDNPDIAEYRGYGDLRVVAGWRGGWQLSALGRMGNDWDKGGLELSLSYPLRNVTRGNLDLYLYGQFWTGYGESLLEYEESTTTFRLGVAIVR